MALAADQKAMLQLLLERGQTYADIADLLGGDEAGVRERARAALSDLGGADPDRNVGLTDYLLGQADPIGRADAARHLKEDAADRELAIELAQKLRLIAPAAQLPKLPGAAADGAARARPRRLSGVRLPRVETGLSGPQGRLMAIIGGLAVALVVIVLAIAGVFSGGGSSSSAADSSSTTTGATTSQVCTSHLCGHPLSLLGDQQTGKFPASGDIDLPIPLSAFQIPLARSAQYVDVTLIDPKTLIPELSQASQASTPIINYEGQTVLRGTVPKNPSAEQLASIKLNPVSGHKGSGTAVFASTKGQPFVEVKLTGMPQPPKGQAYVLWLVFPSSKGTTSSGG